MMVAREPPLPVILSQDNVGSVVFAAGGGNWRLGQAMKRYHKVKFSHRGAIRDCGARGFSLLEMMIVCCIMMIVAGIGFMGIQPALKDARVNQAFEDVMMPLRVARQRAIAERKQYIVCFGVAAPLAALTPMGAPTPQSIQIFRWDAGTALSAAVQISTTKLPTDMRFQVLAGLPNAAATVPDGFGNAAAAIDFDRGVAGVINNQVMFMPDGSAHDVNGSWNSGIIYVARTGDLYSARAVTLYGATGRIRGWRLLTNGGGPKWFQQ
jgi:type II secretory pathway pseudopilin PulG